MKKTYLAVTLFLALTGVTAALLAQQSSPATASKDGSTPLAITDAENASLASSYKDGTILQLSAKLTEDEIAKQNASLDEIHNEQRAWLTKFQGELDAVKKAHKWGADVIFKPEQRGFVRLAPSPAPPPAPAPSTAPPPASGAESKARAASNPVAPAAPSPESK